MATRISDNKLISGLLFIIIGGALLMRNLDLVPGFLPHFLFTWPMILILIGLFNLMGRNDKTSGLILVSIGLFFILPNALGVPSSEIYKFWPLILIIVGLSFLLKQRYHINARNSEFETANLQEGSGFIDVSSIFGGTQKTIDPMEFRGGSISALFGGNEIDLSDCTLAYGNNVLNLNVAFGGAVIIVPAEWNIQIDVTPILGGFVDKRWKNPGFVKDPDSILIIKGTVMFGGGELKNR